MSIPPILHQTWKNESIPSHLESCVQSWRTYNPDFGYRLWTDEDNENLIREKYPWFLPYYNSYPTKIQKVDAIRYFILHYYGGVYVDLDFECLRSFSGLIRENNIFFGEEPAGHARVNGVNGTLICNALMASAPGHVFWEYLFKCLRNRSARYLDRAVGRRSVSGSEVMRTTGPTFLTEVILSYPGRENIRIFDCEVFYPLPDLSNAHAFQDRREHLDVLEKEIIRKKWSQCSYAVHKWSGSWSGKAQILGDVKKDPEAARLAIEAIYSRKRRRARKRVVKYTLLTTMILAAACVGWVKLI